MKHNNIYLFYCIMITFRSTDPHQAISTKLWTKCDAVQIIFLGNDVSNQQDATTFSFINLLNQPYMFRAIDSPILRSTFDCIHSFWYHALTMLSTGATAEMKPVPSQPWHRSAAGSVHCTKSCVYSQKCSWGWTNLSPEMCRADLERLINGRLLHLVGYLLSS